MGLETVDFFHILARDPTSNSYKTGVNVTTAHNQLIATRQELYQNLNKTRELGSRSLVGFLSLFFGKGFGLVSLREIYVAAIFFLSFLLVGVS
jgi:tetrahydromethanopterin S-methyltransferase subunit F